MPTLAPAARPELLAISPIERRTRRGAGIGIAAAAVTVVALAATPTLLRDHGGTTPAAQRSKPANGPVAQTAPLPILLPARTWISYSGPDAVDNLDTVQAQYIDLRPTRDGFQVREITAFAPGLFSTSLIKKPQPVTVNGTRGYFGAVLPWRNDNVSHTDPAHTDPRGSKYPDAMPAVVWKIGADQWAAVISNAPGEERRRRPDRDRQSRPGDRRTGANPDQDRIPAGWLQAERRRTLTRRWCRGQLLRGRLPP